MSCFALLLPSFFCTLTWHCVATAMLHGCTPPYSVTHKTTDLQPQHQDVISWLGYVQCFTQAREYSALSCFSEWLALSNFMISHRRDRHHTLLPHEQSTPMNLESTSERSSLEEVAGTLRMCRRSGSPLLKAGRRRREHRAPVEWFLL